MIPLIVIGFEVNQDLSGTWILNIELSDDFQEKIKEHVKSVRTNRGKQDGYSGASGKRNGRGSGGHPLGSGGGRPSNSQQFGGSNRGMIKKLCRVSLLVSCYFQT